MSTLAINENLIKITGALPVDQALEMDQTYSVGAVIDINDRREKNNHDGTYDQIFTGQLKKLLITDNLGKSIRSKDKTRQSVKLRMAILGLKNSIAVPFLDDDAWYEFIMGGIRHNLPDLIIQIIKDNDYGSTNTQ